MSQPKSRFPFYLQIIAAVTLGASAGVFFGKTSPHYLMNDAASELGLAVIRLLKIFAIPLIFLAITETILKTEITGARAIKVVAICLFNVMIAMAIGLAILNLFEPGKIWLGHMPTTVADMKPAQDLSPAKVIAGLVPESIVDPFVKNNTIGVILIAVLFGFALKAMKHSADGQRVRPIESAIETLFHANLKVIAYILHIIPVAVFLLVGAAVGKSGLAIFSTLWVFLLTIVAGFALHACVYYPVVAWLIGKKSPRVYLGGGASTVLTAFSLNSSLATMPMTLRTLTERMGVSETSARMSACFATNLNNDGITLYEAMTALFLTQALGLNLPIGAQIFIVLVSIFVSMGIAGIPEAGLIILPLVLSSSGLSEAQVAAAIALVVPIDWFIARLRSAVNVMSDMVVAVVLDKI